MSDELNIEKPMYALGQSEQEEKFPQIWMNKMTGDVVVAVPWFDILANDELVSGKMSMLEPGTTDDRKFKMGALSQVGWLIQNTHGVFMGMGPSAAQYFETLGEL